MNSKNQIFICDSASKKIVIFDEDGKYLGDIKDLKTISYVSFSYSFYAFFTAFLTTFLLMYLLSLFYPFQENSFPLKKRKRKGDSLFIFDDGKYLGLKMVSSMSFSYSFSAFFTALLTTFLTAVLFSFYVFFCLFSSLFLKT